MTLGVIKFLISRVHPSPRSGSSANQSCKYDCDTDTEDDDDSDCSGVDDGQGVWMTVKEEVNDFL